MTTFRKNIQYYKFSAYGFLKNLRFFEAFFILFLVEKGLSYTEIGLLYGIREITINLFEIPSGFIADTYGRKNSLAASFILYILSFTTFYFSSSFPLFTMAFLLYGIGDAFRTGTHKGMIMDYLKLNGWQSEKIAYYGHTRAWSQRGSAISSLAAGFIVFYSGSYENIFLYSVIPYLINFLLILSYPAEINLSKSKNRVYSLLPTIKTFINVIKNRKVLAIINSSAVHSAYLKAIKDYIQPLIVSLAIGIPILTGSAPKEKNGAVIGVIYFIIYLLNSYASVLSGSFAKMKKIRTPLLTLIFGFTAGILSGVFYNIGFFSLSIIAFIMIYLIENLRKPILTGYMADNVPNDILVSVISAQSQLKTIITTVIAFVFGLFADKFGIGYSLIFTSGLLLLFTIFVDFYGGKNSTQV